MIKRQSLGLQGYSAILIVKRYSLHCTNATQGLDEGSSRQLHKFGLPVCRINLRSAQYNTYIALMLTEQIHNQGFVLSMAREITRT